MKPGLEIELTRQIFKPGEEVSGQIHLRTKTPIRIRGLVVSLQGEEILGANSITRSVVFPILNQERVFLSKSASGAVPEEIELVGIERPYVEATSVSLPIGFEIPADCPPSYASEVLRCHYYVKGRLDIPWGRDLIEKMHITVVSAPLGEECKPVEMNLEQDGLKVKVEIEKDRYLAGETLGGYLQMECTPGQAPSRIRFELRAVERSTEEDFPFSRVIWSRVREDTLEDINAGEILGSFEFSIPNDVPFSYVWNSFRVDWIFEVTFLTARGQEFKISREIDVHRPI